MKKLAALAGALVIAVIVGCGDDTSGAGGEGGDTTSSSTTTPSASTGTTTATGGQAVLQAPVLDEVEPMHGALHLYWTNTTPDCDMVEGERKVGAGMFGTFFSVPGTVDNEADDGATDPAVVYTYRLRCTKGGQFSGYSNELSASPMAE
jgi:hypothetical protein